MRSIFTALFLLSAASASAQTCPPPRFTTKQNFNPFSYFSGTWYTLKQLPTINQPPQNRFCVKSTMASEFTDGEFKFYIARGSSRGGVTGNRTSSFTNGTIPDLSNPSHGLLQPNSLPYSIIEAGTYADLFTGQTTYSSNGYEWAIISGSPPAFASNGACLPGVGPNNARGVWVLSRQPVVAQEIEDKIAGVAAAKGYDVSALDPIPQEGCTY